MDPKQKTLNLETDTDFSEVYHRCQKFVWLLKIVTKHGDDGKGVTEDGDDGDDGKGVTEDVTKDGEDVHFINGFALHEGYIITVEHDIASYDIVEIRGRPLTEDDFRYILSFDIEESAWDIAWLRIKGVDGSLPAQLPSDLVAKLPSDCSLSVGQELLHIDGSCSGAIDSNFYAGLFSVGRVAFDCLDEVVLPKSDREVELHEDEKLTCEHYYDFDYDKQKCRVVPQYRVMGHICNSFTMSNAIESKTDDAEYVHKTDDAEYVHPQVPLIQMSDLCIAGCSGGPLFNYQGEVVGMMVFAGVSGFSFAIHASMLKEALRELKEEIRELRARTGSV